MRTAPFTAAAGAVVQARARELLALGPSLVDELGRRAAEPMADVLTLLAHVGEETGELLTVNQQLIPLIASMKPSRGPRWWHWFTGELLEREVFRPDLERSVRALTERGERSHAALERHGAALASEDANIARHVETLEGELRAAQVLLSPLAANDRRAAGLHDDDVARLSRRAANLEAMVTASQLTRAQYRVAIEHGRAVSDRFDEVRGLLLPLWKQAMGFEFYSQRVAARTEKDADHV